MILEIAQLQVRAGQAAEFESAFAEAQRIIAAMPGDRGLESQRRLLHHCYDPFPTVLHDDAVPGVGTGP